MAGMAPGRGRRAAGRRAGALVRGRRLGGRPAPRADHPGTRRPGDRGATRSVRRDRRTLPGAGLLRRRERAGGAGHPAALDAEQQTWALDAAAELWRFDVMREPHDGDIWISRRHPSLRRPYASIVCVSPDGIPYLSPEVVLLFKAKYRRPKDEADHALLAPALTGPQRA